MIKLRRSDLGDCCSKIVSLSTSSRYSSPSQHLLQALLDDIVGDGGDGLHLDILDQLAGTGGSRQALGLGDGLWGIEGGAH